MHLQLSKLVNSIHIIQQYSKCVCECLSIDSMFFYLFSIAIFSNFNLLSSLFCGTCGCVVAIIFFISCLCLALSFSICVYVWGVCIIHFRQLDPDFWNDFLITASFLHRLSYIANDYTNCNFHLHDYHCHLCMVGFVHLLLLVNCFYFQSQYLLCVHIIYLILYFICSLLGLWLAWSI